MYSSNFKSYFPQPFEFREITPSQFDNYGYSLFMKAIIVYVGDIKDTSLPSVHNCKSQNFNGVPGC